MIRDSKNDIKQTQMEISPLADKMSVRSINKLLNMKTIIKNLFIGKFAVVVLISVLSACTERWEEMNTNPNNLQDLPDEYLFTTAIRTTFTDQLTYTHVTHAGQYAHIMLGEVKFRDIDKYYGTGSGDYSESIFRGVYGNAIKNITEVLQLTSDGKYKNEYRNAQAQILAVVNFAKLTDLFGDIPYSEAGMGKYGITLPKYDMQEEIYSNMVERLKNSIVILKQPEAESNIYPEAFDPVYFAEVDNWIRFANSVRLRLAMRARFVDPQKYNAIISECLMDVLIEENAQNPILENQVSDDPVLYNSWYDYVVDYENGEYSFLWSEKFINTLSNSNDPRLSFFATKNNDDEYLGMPNGLSDTAFPSWPQSNTSAPTAEFFAKDQPYYLITAGEIWLLRAEAALFSIATGDANVLYQTGVRLAMEQWAINSESIASFFADEEEATLYGDTENQFRQIATQLWIAPLPNTLESWNTIRRTGYPEIPQRTGSDYSQGVTNGYMPTRLFYPTQVERTINGENMEAAIDRMPDGDKIDSRVWWDLE